MKLTLKATSLAVVELCACAALVGCGGGGGDVAALDAAPASEGDGHRVAAATATWATIAYEGQSFSVSGTKLVRYGAGTRWVQKTMTGAGQCTNAFFGTDPAYGIGKSCEVEQVIDAEPAPAPAPAPTPTWTRIAVEGQAFTVSGTATVRYGADTRWVQKSVTSGGQCTNTFFGTDPAHGTVKSCELLGTA
ncbi:MAG TPA: hypothetical protein VFZ93_15080, partial [Albitalea sp.]